MVHFCWLVSVWYNMMRIVIILCFIGVSLALPHSTRLDNPDERGPYYQGDIDGPLPPFSKNGIIDEAYRWPNGVVPYNIFGPFTGEQEEVIRTAMETYTNITAGCIKFVERTDEDDYISFITSTSGCSSYVGRQGGRQTIRYPDWCIERFGSVLHEMYHALGFFHEQSRYDRDDYVTIQYEYIENGAEHNFDKYSSDEVSGFGYAYDYESVMHYSAYAFSVNDNMTIVTVDPAYQDVIGQREGLSDTDLGKLLNMYKCNE